VLDTPKPSFVKNPADPIWNIFKKFPKHISRDTKPAWKKYGPLTDIKDYGMSIPNGPTFVT